METHHNDLMQTIGGLSTVIDRPITEHIQLNTFKQPKLKCYISWSAISLFALGEGEYLISVMLVNMP